jgi:hypothetical protein
MRALLCLLLIAGSFAVAADPSETAAAKAAEKWVATLDAGDYPASWNQAGADFKKAVTLEKWTAAAKSVREPLGKLESRKLDSTQTIKDPPGAPAGEYVICQYNANFANRSGAVETIVMFLESDKQWRTSGYFIK